MKHLFILVAYFLPFAVQAQSLYYSGAKVRFDIIGSDDGIFAEVIQSNGITAQIKYSRISFNGISPVSEDHLQIVPIEIIRPLKPSDRCFEFGSLARITNPFLANANAIGTVIACDGRAVILEQNNWYDQKSRHIYMLGDLDPANENSYAFHKGAIVNFLAKGFAWTGLSGTVEFTDDQYATVYYQDLNFTHQRAKVLVSDLQPTSTEFSVDFSIASLGEGFKKTGSIAYGAKKNYFESLGRDLDRLLPADAGGGNSSSIRYQSRLLALFAAKPIFEGSTSEVFVNQVNPVYQKQISAEGIKNLSQIMMTPEAVQSAGITLGAILNVFKSAASSDVARKLVSDQQVAAALLVASQGKPSALMTYLAQSSALEPMMAKLLNNASLKPYAVAYETVLTYLKEKSR